MTHSYINVIPLSIDVDTRLEILPIHFEILQNLRLKPLVRLKRYQNL